jgi:diguanylate cyclase (GGDEF)-like protein
LTDLDTGDTEQRGCLVTIRDITEYRSTEQELRRLNARLHEQLVEINQLKDKLQDQANRDPLTGLYNRRYLLQMLDYFLAAGRTPISLVMMDIDHFKQINDRHGHLAGDAVLGSIADMLREQLRSPEFACRYGGEEFLIVLPGVSLSQAGARAEEWRRQFQTSPIAVRGVAIEATLSLGVAVSPEQGINSEGLVHSADTALYMAKKRGRNQVALLPLRPLHREPVSKS